jgi:methylmalonyl-CoA/ethylmalonyl-CoA epimerase
MKNEGRGLGGRESEGERVNEFGLIFHHLGLAVRRPEAAIAYHRALGYTIEAPVYDPEQNVRLILCRSAAMPDIELISPADGPSPIDGIVLKYDSAIYHTCFTAPDAAASIARMKAAGLKVLCVAPPKPAVLFGGKKVSFYTVLGVGTIEIIETGAASA